MENLLAYLNSCFVINVGDFDLFLGLQIMKYLNGSIFIHQSNYAEKIIKKYGLENCNSRLTPVDTNSHPEGSSEIVLKRSALIPLS